MITTAVLGAAAGLEVRDPEGGPPRAGGAGAWRAAEDLGAVEGLGDEEHRKTIGKW